MSTPTDWITGAEIRERTGWNAQHLRRRIAAGKFPAKVDFDRWNRAEVEARLAGKWPLDTRAAQADEGAWTVDPVAIRKAHAEITRRAKEAAAEERRRRRKE